MRFVRLVTDDTSGTDVPGDGRATVGYGSFGPSVVWSEPGGVTPIGADAVDNGGFPVAYGGVGAVDDDGSMVLGVVQGA